MNKITVYSLVLLSIIFSSCDRQEYYGKRLVGSWKYTRACHQEKTFRQTDILDEYKNDVISFTSTGQVEISNAIDSLNYIGQYQIDEDFNSNTGPDGNSAGNTEIDLILSYTDTLTNTNYLEIWDQASITKKKIRFQRKIEGKRAYFVLEKQ